LVYLISSVIGAVLTVPLVYIQFLACGFGHGVYDLGIWVCPFGWVLYVLLVGGKARKSIDGEMPRICCVLSRQY
jgi:hypothetical protein